VVADCLQGDEWEALPAAALVKAAGRGVALLAEEEVGGPGMMMMMDESLLVSLHLRVPMDLRAGSPLQS
jgi:hypothetical protein